MHFGRIKALYALAVLALVVILLFADGLARGIAAFCLLVGAVPMWQTIRQFFQSQFWKDVEDVIVASDAQHSEELPSAQE